MNLRLARTPRLWWTGWLIASLLFLQLASAAYACAVRGEADAPQAMAGMPCEQAMADGRAALDAEQPGLCLEHCKGGSVALEQGSPSPLPLPALPAGPLPWAASAGDAGGASVFAAQRRTRDRAPPPPHSILHCCHRI